MTAGEVRAIVLAELVEHSISPTGHEPIGSHGVDLGKCLLSVPERKSFENSFAQGQDIDLWLVLDAGYLVVYDEAREEFGLAVESPGKKPCFVGYYGSFLDTLDSM